MNGVSSMNEKQTSSDSFPSSQMTKEQLVSYFNDHLDSYIDEWKEFLRFASISADDSYHPDCLECADWVKKFLDRIGFRTELLETPLLPLVYGELQGDSAFPTLLIYGHYDVQPPDPLELWKTPPFEPDLREGRLWARGAEDNKGQLFFILKSLELMRAKGFLKGTVRVLIEGGEEIASRGLVDVLEKYRGLFKADVLLVSDTGVANLDEGYLCVGLRGIAEIEYALYGPNRDLHSGIFGGLVRNPAIELSKLIASCFDSSGKISVPGFFDGFVEPSEELKDAAEAGIGFTAEEIEHMLGVPPNGGEQGRGLAERRGLHPTLEVNGLYAGYTGPGGKTIIPQCARVKISIRLVPNLDPARCLSSLTAHLTAQIPQGMRLEVVRSDKTGGVLRVEPDGRYVKVAKSVLAELHGAEPKLLWEGGSVPILSKLASASGAEPILVGYGLERDNIHSPNENFGLDQAEKGFVYYGLLLQRLNTPL